jgi:hypothetical protein
MIFKRAINFQDIKVESVYHLVLVQANQVKEDDYLQKNIINFIYNLTFLTTYTHQVKYQFKENMQI